MEQDVLDALEDIGYSQSIDDDGLEEALKLGAFSVTYTSLVSYLIKELCSFHDIQESVNPVSADNDAESNSYFLMELTGFLREYGCPHFQTKDGSLDLWLKERRNALILLDYLIGEYQAAQLYFTNKPAELLQAKQTDQTVEISCSAHLKHMLIALSFTKPPSTITPFQLFSKVEAKVKELVCKNPNAIGSPLLKAQLTPRQWEKVIDLNRKLTDEYDLRREMLCKRLDVTIQSFLWGEKVKLKQDEALQSYQPLRLQLRQKRLVSIADLLAARDSLLYIHKTNSNRKGSETHINKVMMGKVPDRGGRTGNMQAPAPEMPSFMKRQADPQGQRHSARGGRVQGGWASGGGDRRGYKGKGKKQAGGQQN